MQISNWPLARRLALAFGGVIAIFLAVIVVAMASQSRLTHAQAMNVHTAKVLGVGEQMLLAMVNMETGTRGFALAGEASFLEPWTQGQQSFDSAMKDARKLTADNAEQQRRLESMQTAAGRFKDVAQAVLALRRQVDAGTATLEALSQEVRRARGKEAMDAFRTVQAEFMGAEEKLQTEREAEAHNAATTALWLELGGSALALIVAVVLGTWVTRSITRPLAQAVAVAKAVAVGDLTARIDVRSRDEVGVLLQALRDMNTALVDVVSRVRSGSEAVASASTQIAQGNSDLSGRTESQASALEETAASMEELGSTVQQNADNARQANQLAQAASGVAEQGGVVVAQVVDTMKGISESSRKISDIISVIDGIAFQTNILALNAAVEAARAGEQGRGFAVVASEVRSLAGRSAEAAKEIKQLITDSVARVESGAQLADQAGSTMTEVVASIRRVTDLMGEISAASSEQSSGVSQVGEAVTEMDQTTQQNAALVEEMAAAAASLNCQAQDLVQSVSMFQLGTGTVAAGQPADLRSPAPRSAMAMAPKKAAAPTIAASSTASLAPAHQAAKPAPAPRPRAAQPLRTALAGAGAGAASKAEGDWESF